VVRASLVHQRRARQQSILQTATRYISVTDIEQAYPGGVDHTKRTTKALMYSPDLLTNHPMLILRTNTARFIFFIPVIQFSSRRLTGLIGPLPEGCTFVGVFRW
jgi:hypothetical protein